MPLGIYTQEIATRVFLAMWVRLSKCNAEAVLWLSTMNVRGDDVVLVCPYNKPAVPPINMLTIEVEYDTLRLCLAFSFRIEGEQASEQRNDQLYHGMILTDMLSGDPEVDKRRMEATRRIMLMFCRVHQFKG